MTKSTAVSTGRSALRSALRLALADRVFRRLLLLFVALNLADALTTITILRLGGGEASWLQAWIFTHVSIAAGVTLKFAVATFIAGNLTLTFTHAAQRARWFERAELLLLDGILGLVVLNNLVVLAFILAHLAQQPR